MVINCKQTEYSLNSHLPGRRALSEWTRSHFDRSWSPSGCVPVRPSASHSDPFANSTKIPKTFHLIHTTSKFKRSSLRLKSVEPQIKSESIKTSNCKSTSRWSCRGRRTEIVKDSKSDLNQCKYQSKIKLGLAFFSKLLPFQT